MKKSMINRSHIEGYLYEHKLDLKVSGPNSKTPGTEFISGQISIATDDEMVNIVPVHFTYVTATTSKGTPNATYAVLKDIIDGKTKSVMIDGSENASKLKIDTAIGLNEFYSDRNGEEELVSVKRNEGGFVHVIPKLSDDEKLRNIFEVDMLITGTRRVEADEERQLPEKLILKGAIFDFKKALLPVEFSVLAPAAMNYFEGLEPSSKSPVFTKLRGRQVSEVIKKTITEESAFGEASVREVESSRKDFVIFWAQKEPYIWDDEETITGEELQTAMANRQTHLATIKKRQDEYKASKGAAKGAAKPAASGDYAF